VSTKTAIPSCAVACDDARLDRLLTQHEVTNLTSLSKRSIYRLLATGKFPRPVRVSQRRVAWQASAIAAWQRGISG